MTPNEIKHGLRKYDFPVSAKEALYQIDQIFMASNLGSLNKQLDLAMDIISEFIFCEVDRRPGQRVSKFEPFEELQLTILLIEFLGRCPNETARNSMLLLLFGGAESQRRLKILYLLTTIAMSNNNIRIISSVSVWMQQTGCSSPQAVELTEKLVNDLFFLSFPKQMLRSFAKTIPEFVANFMSCVTEVYFRECNRKVKRPPRNLVETITFWVTTYPNICEAAQNCPVALPNRAIPREAANPLAGLINFCTLAALYPEIKPKNTDDTPPPVVVEIVKPEPLTFDEYSSRRKFSKKPETEEVSAFVKYDLPDLSPPPSKKSDEEPIEITETEDQIYNRLVIGIWNCLRLAKPKECPIAVNAQNLSTIVPPIINYAKRLQKKNLNIYKSRRLEQCTERLARLINMAIHSNCIYGNINVLLETLTTIPEYRALSIVIKKNKEFLNNSNIDQQTVLK